MNGRQAQFFKWLAIAAVIALTVEGAITAKLYSTVSHRGVERAQAIRAGQIQNCAVVGDPLRAAVVTISHAEVQEHRKQVKRYRSTDWHRLFPNLDAGRLHAMARSSITRERDGIQRARDVIATLHAVPPCAERYPPLPHTG